MVVTFLSASFTQFDNLLQWQTHSTTKLNSEKFSLINPQGSTLRAQLLHTRHLWYSVRVPNREECVDIPQLVLSRLCALEYLKWQFRQLARVTFTLASGHRAVCIVKHSSTYCVKIQTQQLVVKDIINSTLGIPISLHLVQWKKIICKKVCFASFTNFKVIFVLLPALGSQGNP